MSETMLNAVAASASGGGRPITAGAAAAAPVSAPPPPVAPHALHSAGPPRSVAPSRSGGRHSHGSATSGTALAQFGGGGAAGPLTGDARGSVAFAGEWPARETAAATPAVDGPRVAAAEPDASSAGRGPARPHPPDPERHLVVPPVVHVYGGPSGGLAGERSAGFDQWVDDEAAITPRNLVGRLFVNQPRNAARFIRLGSLYSAAARARPATLAGGATGGAGEADRETAAVGSGAGGTRSAGARDGGGGGRSPPGDDRTPPQRARDAATYDLIVGMANHAIGFGLTLSSLQAVTLQALHLAETGQHDAVAAIASAIKNAWLRHTVSATNSGMKQTMQTYRPCVGRFCRWAEDEYGDGASMMPVSRNMVVAFLEAEKLRRVAGRKRRRDEDDGPDGDGEVVPDGDDERHPICTTPPDALSTRGVSGRPSGQQRGPGPARPTEPPTGAGNTPGAVPAGTPRATVAETPPPRVGPMVLTNSLNALAKIGSLFNLPWTASSCDCCRRWRVDEFSSAGSFPPAVSVVGQRKREAVLQRQATGSNKAIGKRDAVITDAQRRDVVRELLLCPRTAVQFVLKSLISALFVMTFALEARGATARGLVWSDLALRKFEAMFSAGGQPVDVLCTYITATKTTEGNAHCIGCLPHVDPWLCPFGAVADAAVALCHAPGQDPTVPPTDLQPVLRPNDDELQAAGVLPAHYREAGTEYGFRPWYKLLLFPAPRGGPFKEMTYRYHNDSTSKVMMAKGVPDWAAKTHICRRAAAQRGSEAGASESDNKRQGLWSQGMARGAYDAPIPNMWMTLVLSGRPLTCTSPSTPRLSVEVPESLRARLFPWLEAEERAYAARKAADASQVDAALEDFFLLLRSTRSVYFQTWAARLATGGVPADAYVLNHPLLAGDEFTTFAAAMRSTLANAADRASAAAAQVLPQLAHTVEAAVEAAATSTMAQLVDVRQYLSARLDASTLATNEHAEATADEVMRHTDSGVSTVNAHTSQEVASLRAEVARLTDVVIHLAGGRLPPAVRASLGPAGAPRVETGSALRAFVAEPLPSPPRPTPATRTRPATAAANAVPVALLRDRDNVRQLQVQGKLNGVAIYDDHGQYVPLLPMEKNLSWPEALDEYAVGVCGRAGIREVEQLFGSRWRLLVPDRALRTTVGKLYSSRLVLYRAFDKEYARGHSEGVAGVLSVIKRKFKEIRGSKAAYKAMEEAYPA